MCGIYGTIGSRDVFTEVVEGIFFLQHRGQEGAGILLVDKERGTHVLVKTTGNVNTLSLPADTHGTMGLGHVRYTTTGTNNVKNNQPLWTDQGNIGFVHNGQVQNMEEMSLLLAERGMALNSESDGELLLRYFAEEYRLAPGTSEERAFIAARKTQQKAIGGYAIVMTLPGVGLLGFRDPHGVRPLLFGSKAGYCSFSSESIALSMNGYAEQEDVQHGEAVLIREDLTIHREVLAQRDCANCGFEYFYFGDAASTMNGQDINEVRYDMGKLLAARTIHLRPDIVVPVPESSRAAAAGYTDASGVRYSDSISKYRPVNRIYITPGQEARKKKAQQGFRYFKKAFRNKSVLLIDDSIVRGTNITAIIENIRKAGAREVHVAITWPPIRHHCPLGIVMRHDLIAQHRTNEEICTTIGADSLTFASLQDVHLVLGRQTICSGCITGEYPTGVR